MLDYEEMYKHLVLKVREMMAAQKAYFKSNKNFTLLNQSKKLEAEVDAIVNPKPANQTKIF